MNLNDNGFTLLEVLLASIIFVVSVAGVFATLNAVRAPVTQKETALSAAIVGQQVLNYLRGQVNTTTYYNAACTNQPAGYCTSLDLVLGVHQVLPSQFPANTGISWPANVSNINPLGLIYNVSCGAGATNDYTTCGSGGSNIDQSREVTLNINSS